MTFAAQFKLARSRLKLTLAELSLDCGVPVATLRGYESGRRELSLDAGLRVARSLGIDFGLSAPVEAGRTLTRRQALTRAARLARAAEELFLEVLRGPDLPVLDAAQAVAIHFASATPGIVCPLPHGPVKCRRCGGTGFLTDAEFV